MSVEPETSSDRVLVKAGRTGPPGPRLDPLDDRPKRPAGKHWAIDPFRGLVCLSIVVMHFYTGAVVDLRAGVFNEWVLFAVSHLRLGYESFFVISGFFLAHMFRKPASDYLSVRRVIARRFVRLALPYWVAVGVGLTALLVREAVLGIPSRQLTTGDVLAQLFFLQDVLGAENVSLVFWSMATLMQFYVLAMVGFWLVRLVFLRVFAAEDYHVRTERVLVAATLALAAGSAAVLAVNPGWQWQLPQNGIYFAIGALVYWRSAGRLGLLPLAAVAIGAIALGVWLGNSRLLAGSASAIVMAWLSAGHPIPQSLLTRGLAYVGRHSYSIYLTHAMVGPRVLHLAPLSARQDSQALALCLTLAATTVAVIVGMVFYNLVEEPVRRWSLRIRYRR